MEKYNVNIVPLKETQGALAPLREKNEQFLQNALTYFGDIIAEQLRSEHSRGIACVDVDLYDADEWPSFCACHGVNALRMLAKEYKKAGYTVNVREYSEYYHIKLRVTIHTP